MPWPSLSPTCSQTIKYKFCLRRRQICSSETSVSTHKSTLCHNPNYQMLWFTGCEYTGNTVSHIAGCLSPVDVLLCILPCRYNMVVCKIWGFHSGDYEECRRFGSHKIYTAPHPRRRHSSTWNHFDLSKIP
jgi:hypothetical protein